MPGIGRSNGYDFVLCQKHACKNCGSCNHHRVQGPAAPKAGAKEVKVNKFPALRIGDTGQHDKQTCCGPNKWVAVATAGPSREVFIEGKEAFCIHDIALHCGADQGKLMAGSLNVIVGKS